MTHSFFLTDLLLIIGSATLISLLFHALRFPTLVGFLGTGMLIGPYGLSLVSETLDTTMMTEIGAVLLLFTLGLEFSFRRLIQFRKMLFGLGFLQVSTTVILFCVVSKYLLDFSWPKALTVGFIVSLSSTATVLKLLQDARDTESPYGQGAVAILLFQDIALIPMILAIQFLSNTSSDVAAVTPMTSLLWVGKTLLIVGGVWISSRTLIPIFLSKVVKTASRELFFFCLLSLCFGTAFLFETWGLSLSLGAFVAGVMISDSPYGKQATIDLVPFRDNFLALFFISIGMLLDLQFVANNWPYILLCFGALMLAKVPNLYLIARYNLFPHSVSLFLGMVLFQIGEFSFILADSAQSAGLLSENELQYILSVSILSLGVTPFLYRMTPKLKLKDFFQSLKSPDIKKSTQAIAQPEESTPEKESGLHTIIVGYGVAGQNLGSALRGLEIPYRIIEMNSETVTKFSKQGEDIYYGDASQREILEQAGIETARLVVVTVMGNKMIDSVLRSIRKIRSDIHVILRTEYLRNAKPYMHHENVDLVIGEFETTLEILSRALTTYGVSSKDIHNFVFETHNRMIESHGAFQDSLRRNISLPTWDALNAIHPFTLSSKTFGPGKTLIELNLRQETGASLILVYRPTLGSTIPTADFVLEAGDVVYLVGDSASISKAENLLNTPTE